MGGGGEGGERKNLNVLSFAQGRLRLRDREREEKKSEEGNDRKAQRDQNKKQKKKKKEEEEARNGEEQYQALTAQRRRAVNPERNAQCRGLSRLDPLDPRIPFSSHPHAVFPEGFEPATSPVRAHREKVTHITNCAQTGFYQRNHEALHRPRD